MFVDYTYANKQFNERPANAYSIIALMPKLEAPLSLDESGPKAKPKAPKRSKRRSRRHSRRGNSKSQQKSPLEIIEFSDQTDDADRDAVLDNVAAVLSGFYEVESASYGLSRRGKSAPKPVFGLRVHASYRTRTVAILDSVRQAAANAGLKAEVVLMDNDHVRSFRSNSLVFFPRRRCA